MKKVYLDAGHGGMDSGATGHGLYEKNLTLAIVKEIKRQLMTYDVMIHTTRLDDIFLSLGQRTDKANDLDCDLFVSVHINAGGGQGFESYIYNGNWDDKVVTKMMQETIHNEIMRATNFRVRGKKEANFHVLRESTMPAILTENGFIDNKYDADLLKSGSFIRQIASGHVNGIVRYLKLKKKVIERPPERQDGKAIYKVQVFAGSHEGAMIIAEQLKADGYDSFVYRD